MIVVYWVFLLVFFIAILRANTVVSRCHCEGQILGGPKILTEVAWNNSNGINYSHAEKCISGSSPAGEVATYKVCWKKSRQRYGTRSQLALTAIRARRYKHQCKEDRVADKPLEAFFTLHTLLSLQLSSTAPRMWVTIARGLAQYKKCCVFLYHQNVFNMDCHPQRLFICLRMDFALWLCTSPKQLAWVLSLVAIALSWARHPQSRRCAPHTDFQLLSESRAGTGSRKNSSCILFWSFWCSVKALRVLTCLRCHLAHGEQSLFHPSLD